MEDLKTGMKLPGIVTNVTNFGAFVDIGVHQDGLVHISEMSDTFVSNPAEILSVQQQVEVTVTSVDVARKRIALSMKTGEKPKPKKREKPKPQPRKEKAPETDMATKLAALKGKFGG